MRLLLLTLTLLAAPRASAQAPAPSSSETAKLQRLSRDFWDDFLTDNPGYATFIGDRRSDRKLYDESERAYQRRFATARRFLARARAIDARALAPTDRVSLDVLQRRLALALEGEALHCYLEENILLPLNQMEGLHHRLLSLPTTHPFATARDYENYLARLRAFPPQVDAVIHNMRRGIALGVVQPRAVVERVLPQLEAGATAAAADSPLYEPVRRFPEGLGDGERARLEAAIVRALETHVRPGFRRLHAFMRDEYLPRARSTFAMSALPRGDALYAYALKVRTTTDLSADAVHALNLAQLEKAERERAELVRSLGFAGTPAAFNAQLQEDKAQRWFDAASVERDLRESLEAIRPKLPQLFANLPRVDYALRPVEPFRAASFPNGAFIPGSQDGRRAGIFLYNTHNVETEGVRKFLLPALAFHEVVPGHMLQAEYASASTSLPAFRRFGGNAAYNEGWATYAESLAEELGAYRDGPARNFYLTSKVYSHASAVAETGLHAKGWTPEQAAAFLRKYVAMPPPRFDMTLARWAVLPAQNLGYGIGALKCRELRERATRELGERFDVREFHAVVLGAGNVPLDVLDGIVTEWIATRKGT
ncbi:MULTISPECIES: DUF885 family protein [Myxococcaceae]|uniref:DUF885 domain-containing protein n=1 Tax=Myxococcaceae TaxID=31 RepID=UPI00188E71C4|nr:MULTISPECIES: DUF885 domain-containing protein [Myxococcaceae]MBF5041877.1 DUF885 domain-containing protein [Simulacricoccus sp. 17bor-14]